MNEVTYRTDATSQLSHADRWRLEAEAEAKAKAEAQAEAQRVRDEVELEYHSALLSGEFDRWPKAKADRARKILELSRQATSNRSGGG